MHDALCRRAPLGEGSEGDASKGGSKPIVQYLTMKLNKLRSYVFHSGKSRELPTYQSQLRQMRSFLCADERPSADVVQRALGHGVKAGKLHCVHVYVCKCEGTNANILNTVCARGSD